jgi:phosphoribosyl 1,2-cyclic phosphodiesterase
LTAMSLFIASLNSGSNGNCYYAGNENEAILIDAGISCRETEKRMSRLQLSMKKVKAIFISHEHADHIKGLQILSQKYQLPVYITQGTHKASGLQIQKDLVYSFTKNKPVHIGNLSIIPFSKFHDAENPHSFIVSCKDVKAGIFTDIGYACKDVINYFSQCNAAFLESNYDEHMLMNGTYPAHLKNRISNGKGHLSNKQALELFRLHRPAFMSHLLLSHLSHNNNTPEIVYDLFTKYAGKTKIIIASRKEETAVYHITSSDTAKASIKTKPKEKHIQLSLF